MSTVQIVGAVLLGSSLLVSVWCWRMFTVLLNEDEQARKDLARDANPCTQELRRFQA